MRADVGFEESRALNLRIAGSGAMHASRANQPIWRYSSNNSNSRKPMAEHPADFEEGEFRGPLLDQLLRGSHLLSEPQFIAA